MSICVLKNLTLPTVCELEVLRYAGVRERDAESEELLSRCIREGLPLVAPAVCYTELALKISDNICDFENFSVKSSALAKRLRESERTLLFAVTLGLPFERLLAKYNKLSPSAALMLSAFGTERVEALCDVFLERYSKEKALKLTKRFSPGYEDLPLEVQREIFGVLDPYRNIGVALGGSLIMTPTKSVTAFAGII